MKRVIITKGLPGSGKSTWAKALMKEHPGAYKRINKDDLRAMLDDSYWSKGNEKYVIQVRNMLITKALEDGKHVIIDDTNLHPKHEMHIRELVKEFTEGTNHQVQVELKFFDVPLEECIRRDLLRHNSVGEKVIRQMHRQFIAKISDRKPYRMMQNSDLPRAIMCDLDGTLAILDRNPYDASTCDEDGLNLEVAEILKNYKKLGHQIILLTGRLARYKEPTLRFLEKHEIPYDHLFMRADKDNRKDSIIKKELFDAEIRDKFYIDFVLDDRNQVVDMWRNEVGLLCCQVAPGDF